ncbi:MAG: MBL fold metallo-hydrolase [Clostridia bacterium]|nr:MBL fold metallo-hydrolase [Clostridia bacterium]MBN2882101.1 MBL fold metallo-hydrolase [Clostridia bacterium]
MFRFCSLFSGSNGNSLFVTDGETRLLVDAGVSGIRIQNALASIGENPASIDAIFVTHEHSDHSQSVGILSRRYNIPVYATKGTWRGMRSFIGNVNELNVMYIDPEKSILTGHIEVHPFRIPHDATEPVGYSFRCENKKLTIATDIGHMNSELLENIRNSDLLMLESNHDLEMLDNGPYPYVLKRRIKSDYGHLCNSIAGETIAQLALEGVKKFIIGHLSGENNNPAVAYRTVGACIESIGFRLGEDIELHVAERGITSKVFYI